MVLRVAVVFRARVTVRLMVYRAHRRNPLCAGNRCKESRRRWTLDNQLDRTCDGHVVRHRDAVVTSYIYDAWSATKWPVVSRCGAYMSLGRFDGQARLAK